MVSASKYVATQPDADGFIRYRAGEHRIWRDLLAAQQPQLAGRACAEFIEGLRRIQLPALRIPQCQEVSEHLTEATGWQVTPVEALIGQAEFFELLSQKIFPAASFIRSRQEFDYLQEPDIFHELFGHTPLLTNPLFAEFSQRIGEIGITAGEEYHSGLARLYWRTIEFGLIDTPHGLRAYGAGIVSSYQELTYSLEGPQPERRPFNLSDILAQPYQIDVLQPLYFVLDNFRQLLALGEADLINSIDSARERAVS